jgi:type I restriction-modification system DNA methylase subunit
MSSKKKQQQLPKEVLIEHDVNSSSQEELKEYYDKVLNMDKSTYKSSNDEPTPIDCIGDMIDTIPDEFWKKESLSILDPCCGNGNFFIPMLPKLMRYHSKEKCLIDILEFNDINQERLQNVRKVFCGDVFNLKITCEDFLTRKKIVPTYYDLIVANPPYAKLLEDGKRASKNHNLIKSFIEQSLLSLKPNGYLLFITPDNWMSYADRNTLIERLTELQIVHLDIHSAKKYFKKIGSSFTWYLIQNCPAFKDITVSGNWKKMQYVSNVKSLRRKYIPLLYSQLVQNILLKTVDDLKRKKFAVNTSSDLHRYTKKELISNDETEEFRYRLIHTPSQTVYASRPHKFQEGYKVFISTTDKYSVFIDSCGMTQSIVFILCDTEELAKKYIAILNHPLYVFVNNICRWGNFNNIRILQSFPVPDLSLEQVESEEAVIYSYFGITEEEVNYIKTMI